MDIKRKALQLFGTLCAVFYLLGIMGIRSYASDDGTFVTISVEATDDNEGLTYALDSTDPNSFTSNSTFQVDNGSTHTIYVKDVAGNITSRTYTAQSADSADYYLPQDPEPTSNQGSATVKDDKTDTEVSVDVDLYQKSGYAGKDSSAYEAAGGGKEPAEPGGGTVYDKTVTEGSADDPKIFYTVETKDGNVFYMVVDQQHSDDNVYLLDQVTLTDLQSMAQDNLSEAESEESKSLLNNLSSSKGVGEDDIDELLLDSSTDTKTEKPKVNTGVRFLVFMLIIAAIGGVYYYMKVYRNKRDEQMDAMDALDRDDFEVDDNRFDDEKDDEEIDWNSEEDIDFGDNDEPEFIDDESNKADASVDNDIEDSYYPEESINDIENDIFRDNKSEGAVGNDSDGGFQTVEDDDGLDDVDDDDEDDL